MGEVFLVALRLGLTSFGGPAAHLGTFRREYVERRAWLDDHAYGDLLALSQSLPGPSSSQLGIAIGTRRAGIAGGVAAWLGFTLPSAILLVLLASFATTADIADAGWVHGLKLAAVAVVAAALLSMARTLTPDPPRLLVAAVACGAALVWVTPFSQVAIIASGALIGWLALAPPPLRPTGPEPSTIPRRLGLAFLVVFAALLLGLPIARSVADSPVLAQLDAFYRAGALVFGGGHVVLPLLDATVVDPGWVTESAFLAGYGAAQAVPGPLFSFAAYLGAVSSVPPGGWLGGAIALVAIYLPSFLLVFGTLPVWDRIRGSERVRRALTGTNAAVVGLLAAALWTPVWTSAVSRPGDVAVVGLGFALLLTGRVPPIAVVAMCAVLGELL
ncbi:MAG: chromate efflux transporter [Candidatus Limnocylindrales bacterium]